MIANTTSLHNEINDYQNHLNSLYYSAYFTSNVSIISLTNMIKNAERRLMELKAMA